MGASFEDLNASTIEIFFGLDAQIDGITTNSIFPSHFFIELILIWKVAKKGEHSEKSILCEVKSAIETMFVILDPSERNAETTSAHLHYTRKECRKSEDVQSDTVTFPGRTPGTRRFFGIMVFPEKGNDRVK
ncbi:hypothetical protein HPP92_010052 [Vanilla planifolia]|uniref:Uncharacterized protein n=1 Tax=Vanilla planifolia TaxID=51239 RepID=A0A835RGK0_VANPL|nr:hypothetical protein HPP92_010052 [Vanilla planifolia]